MAESHQWISGVGILFTLGRLRGMNDISVWVCS